MRVIPIVHTVESMLVRGNLRTVLTRIETLPDIFHILRSINLAMVRIQYRFLVSISGMADPLTCSSAFWISHMVELYRLPAQEVRKKWGFEMTWHIKGYTSVLVYILYHLSLIWVLSWVWFHLFGIGIGISFRISGGRFTDIILFYPPLFAPFCYPTRSFRTADFYQDRCSISLFYF